MGDFDAASLLGSLGKLHTTPMGAERIKKNFALNADEDAVAFCKARILDDGCVIRRQGRRRKDNGQRALPHDYHGAHHGFRPSPREGLKIRIAGCCYFCRFILNITNNARNITCS